MCWDPRVLQHMQQSRMGTSSDNPNPNPLGFWGTNRRCDTRTMSSLSLEPMPLDHSDATESTLLLLLRSYTSGRAMRAYEVRRAYASPDLPLARPLGALVEHCLLPGYLLRQ